MKLVKYFVILLMMLVYLPIQAQTVSYTYKALAAEGCNMKYSVSKQGNDYSIVATVRSDRMVFLSNPAMKIKTFDGDVIELKGNIIGGGSQSAGIVSGNLIIPVTSINSTAQFSISPEQFELFKCGVAKIRLSMTPMNHERTFKKDKIGKKLYEFYLKEKLKDEDF